MLPSYWDHSSWSHLEWILHPLSNMRLHLWSMNVQWDCMKWYRQTFTKIIIPPQADVPRNPCVIILGSRSLAAAPTIRRIHLFRWRTVWLWQYVSLLLLPVSPSFFLHPIFSCVVLMNPIYFSFGTHLQKLLSKLHMSRGNPFCCDMYF